MPILAHLAGPLLNTLLHVPRSLGAKAVETVVLPLWIEQVANKRAPVLWRQVFADAVAKTPELPAVDLEALALKPSLLRILLNSFRPERQARFPDCRQFALSLALELRFSQVETSPHAIRKLAANAHRLWCTTLKDNPALKAYLKETRDVHPTDVMEDTSCSPELDPVLVDFTTLASEYFATYSQASAPDVVTVWLGDARGAVEYSEQESQRLAVAMLTAQEAEYGFFRPEFDYSLERDNRRLWLRWVLRDSHNFTERAVFQGYPMGNTEGEQIWAL